MLALPIFTGSEATAACGGRKEPSEWLRSARAKPALPGEGAAGHRNRTVTRQLSSAYMCLTSVFGMAASPSAAGGGFSEGAACAAFKIS